MRELEKRLTRFSLTPADIDAIIVTHEHGDHIRGVGPVARRYGMPVWMTHGTRRGSKCGDIPDLNLFSAHCDTWEIGDIEISPCPVPHDAREPSQFVFRSDGRTLGVLTDLGSLTPVVVRHLSALDALLLECNHDREMLRNGPYPPSLQARVGGDFGHLSNEQAASLLLEIDTGKLEQLVIGHISEKNNHPDLAINAIRRVVPDMSEKLTVLAQDTVSDWFNV